MGIMAVVLYGSAGATRVTESMAVSGVDACMNGLVERPRIDRDGLGGVGGQREGEASE